MSKRLSLVIVLGLLALALWSTTIAYADGAVAQDARVTPTPSASGRLPPSGVAAPTAEPNRLPPSGGGYDPSGALLIIGAGSALMALGLAARERQRRRSS